MTVSAPAESPALRLVAIGVNDYFQPAWELFYARNDAKTIASAFRSRGARLFETVRADTLLDSSAVKSKIRDGILEQGASPRDVLVVYFSGHGYALEEEDGWEWFLIPFSNAWERSAATDKELNQMVRQHALSSRELMNILAEAEAQRVFLILDACQSGAMVEALQSLSGPELPSVDDAVAQKALQRVARVGGIHVLAASRAHELADELLVEPHGALTFLVLKAMEGQADGAGGGERNARISVREIVEYAGQEMPNLARKLKQPPISQKPVGYSRGEDFEIAEF